MQEARARHEMALELLGERNEAVEELEDAVAEMKCAALLSNAPRPCTARLAVIRFLRDMQPPQVLGQHHKL
jgi:hypothetical protein